MSLLLAGLPYTVPSETVNRLCSTGLSAIIHANRAIKAGDGDLFISGGVENMTRGSYVISKTSSAFGNDSKMCDSITLASENTQSWDNDIFGRYRSLFC